MSDEFSVNSASEKNYEVDEISLDLDMATNQFSIVPNALIRDQTISPECRWLIIFLCSNQADWVIKTKYIWKHTQGFIGRNKIRKILNEAIDAGYMQRIKFFKNNLKAFRYVVSNTPKFKNNLQDFKKFFRETGFRGPENGCTKEILYKNKKEPSLKGFHKKSTADAETLTDVRDGCEEISQVSIDLGNELIAKMKTIKPDSKPPNSKKLYESMDAIIRIDKRNPDLVRKVFNWALVHHIWAATLFKPNPAKYLRDKFDQMEMQMNAKVPQFQQALVDRRTKNQDGTPVEDTYKDNLF